jgi:putative nucleotidyltransferase with HDIG domain
MTAHALVVDEEKVTRERAERARIVSDRTRELARVVASADTASVAALDTLLVALHRRNPDAVAHARRVAKITLTLASDLGVSETELPVIERAALLHDIGKLVMPRELMARPAALTRSDIDLIRSHPRAAYTILSAAPSLRLAADIVLSSHEAWDGSGYPRGAVGRAIPIGSRIIALADTYDAMTWSSDLGALVSPVRAAAELVRASGTYFDPDVVRAWLRRLDCGATPGCEPNEFAFNGGDAESLLESQN